MARKSAARRVTGELADLTGRSDDELRLVLTLAAAGGLVAAAIHTVRVLTDLGSSFRAHPRAG
ncbi:MAG TPA: hypothetical protein VFY58_00910 [Nocardioides sp.]|nr:hypothetical protein [Nocardioides sp.]